MKIKKEELFNEEFLKQFMDAGELEDFLSQFINEASKKCFDFLPPPPIFILHSWFGPVKDSYLDQGLNF